MIGRRPLLCCAWVGLFGCSKTPDAASVHRHAHLPSGVIARVGDDEISLATAQRIARAQGVTLPVARDRALRDALFSAGARSAFGSRGLLPVLERAALARVLLEGLRADAIARGPASDAEVAELTALRWRELDRPEAARTTHAVAMVENPADDEKAHALAKKIYDAVRGVTDPDEFLRLAKAVPPDGVQMRAERLPPVTADGRVYDPSRPSGDAEQAFDLDFAKAATALGVGQISEPTKTRFGYHVILSEARLPELRVPLEERRQLLQDEVIKGRAERSKQELLAQLAAAAPIQITRAVEDLTSRVQVKE
jgi:PPIC-type PPIASE domain